MFAARTAALFLPERRLEMAIDALIVDDEPMSLRRLEIALRRNPRVGGIRKAMSVDGALRALEERKPDVVLLDIEMPGRNGFEFVRALEPDDAAPELIIVSANAHHTLRAFDVSAVDFVLKPVNEIRLAEAVDRAASRARTTDATRRCAELEALLAQYRTALGEETERIQDFWIRDRHRRLRVPAEDVERIEAARDYVLLHTPTGVFIVRQTMTDLADKLDPAQFVRTHRSHIVNATEARALVNVSRGQFGVQMESGFVAPVGRSFVRDVRARFG